MAHYTRQQFRDRQKPVPVLLQELEAAAASYHDALRIVKNMKTDTVARRSLADSVVINGKRVQAIEAVLIEKGALT